MEGLKLREHCQKRLGGLSNLRKPWEPGAEEVARNTLRWISPYMRNLGSTRGDAQRSADGSIYNGGQANNRLYNSKASRAHRTLASGMSSGMSSPSQPWFRLKVGEGRAADVQAVKEWIDDVTAKIYAFLAQTNIYNAMQSSYRELGVFGVSAILFTPHPMYGAVAYAQTFGQYWVGQDDGLRVDSMLRDCSMTVADLVNKFSEEKVSPAVKRLITAGKWDAQVSVRHLIEPNTTRAYGKVDRTNKVFRSIYFETASDAKDVLDIGGFDRKPFAVPRWEAMDTNVYSTGPGFDALPDARKLQLQEIRLQQSMDYLVRPALNMGVSGQNRGANLIPGGITWTDDLSAGRAGPVWEINYGAVGAISGDISNRTEPAIDEAFFTPLFNMFQGLQGAQPRTAEEIVRRHEERLSLIGPVVDRVQVEKLSVIVLQAFEILSAANRLQPVPQELLGTELSIEFVSILAQAQRMIGLQSMERALGFVGNIAGVYPAILDKPNFEEMVNEYVERLGVPARTMHSDEDVAAVRQQRAQAEQQRQQMEQMAAMAPAVKDVAASAELLSRTDVNSPSALSTLMPQPGV
jgi:hypothetical protein